MHEEKEKKNKFIDEDEDLIVRLINRLLTQGVWPTRDEQVRAHLSSLQCLFSSPASRIRQMWRSRHVNWFRAERAR